MRHRRPVLVALLVVALAACGSTPVDQVGLKYGKGPIEGEHFEEIVEPGSGTRFLFNDSLVKLPINQRDYTFCADVRSGGSGRGCDGPPISVAALGGAELAFSGGVTFKVNTSNEQVTRRFHEEVCRKFSCTNDAGWDEMLRVVMRGPIEDALQEEVRGFSVDAIYAGVPAEGEQVAEEVALSTLTQISDNLARTLRETINSYAGGEYFCGPAYNRAAPDSCAEADFEFIITDVTPSEEVKAAFDRNVASRQGVIDARNKADAAEAEARGQAAAKAALDGLYTDPAYIDYLNALALQQCASNSNCTLIVGSSAGVNVTPRQP